MKLWGDPMPAVNEIVAVFGNRSECTTATVYQYNYGERLRIVKDDLPEHYRVDFANSVSGQSKSMLGSADVVLIPYEYFVPGSYIHAWIVYLGADYAITKGHIIIPISPKAQNTDETPEPEPQRIIDQTIAALNDGVDRAETAAENAEQAVANVKETVDAALQEAKDSGEFDGPQGEQGIQGDPGPTGNPGAMLAFSPPTIERAISNGKVRAGSISMPFAAYLGDHRIACRATSYANTEWTVKITQSTDSSNGWIDISWNERTVGASLPKTIRFDFAFNNITVTCNVPVTHVYNGANGATGSQGATFTPSVSAEGVISWSNDAGLPNPESVDIKGPPGEPGAGVSIHICSSSEYDAITRVPTVQNPEANTFYLVPAENAASPDMFVEWIFTNNAWEMFGSATVEVPVQDVQVNGVSVLQDGVANVPIANSVNPGVIIVKPFNGHTISNGIIGHKPAADNTCKKGTDTNDPITPSNQHTSTFYGFAKAAGADMASISSTTIGIYPEVQKSAIHKMLNGAVSISGSTPTITAMPGVRYVCGEVATLDITLPESGCIDVMFESGSTATVLTITPPSGQTLKWANGFDPTALDANTTYELNIADGLGVAGSWT